MIECASTDGVPHGIGWKRCWRLPNNKAQVKGKENVCSFRLLAPFLFGVFGSILSKVG